MPSLTVKIRKWGGSKLDTEPSQVPERIELRPNKSLLSASSWSQISSLNPILAAEVSDRGIELGSKLAQLGSQEAAIEL